MANQTFVAADNRKYTVDVNVTQVKRLKSKLQLDILSIFSDGENNVLVQLASDPVLLGDALYVLCESQCKSAGISEDEFGAALSGDVIAHATDAMMEAIVNFFQPERRANLKRALEKLKQMQARETELSATRLENPKLMTMLEKFHEQQMAKIDALTLTDSAS